MSKKNTYFRPKKIPYYIALTLLTAGASLILGFLSFGGMYALLPLLPLAVATFILSVGYEGEIYLQNIKGAFKKLLKNNYLEHQVAKEYLLKHFPAPSEDEEWPQFFKDYKAQLELLDAFGHHSLNKQSQQKKEQIKQTLKDMETWFAQQLFQKTMTHGKSSIYTQELHEWLKTHAQKEWQERIKTRKLRFHLAQGFSVCAALFMGLGSTYLIVEAFTIIPFIVAIPFTFWPFMIVPMALIAGTAYGMLTYNAITDLINNNTIVSWYKKLRADLSQGLTFRKILMTSTAVLLAGLAVALTVCTAGTWWTVATNARPLFAWMKHMPSFIMGVINPIVTGASAIFFNLENTAESLEMIDQAMQRKKNFFQRTAESLQKGWQHIKDTENWLQMINPFRLLLKITITPLRIILFLGHLFSIGFTADRMPGMPKILAALIAIISEGFEDAHYFVGHDHEHEEGTEPHNHDDEAHQHTHPLKTLLKERLEEGGGHNHNLDLPTLGLKSIAIPLYALAALWDSWSSRLNRHAIQVNKQQKNVLSFSQAWKKQFDIEEEKSITPCEHAAHPSNQWQQAHIASLLEKRVQKLEQVSMGKSSAQAKINALTKFKDKMCQAPASEWKKLLQEEQKNPVYNQHRLFAVAEAQCATQQFMSDLSARVSLG